MEPLPGHVRIGARVVKAHIRGKFPFAAVRRYGIVVNPRIARGNETDQERGAFHPGKIEAEQQQQGEPRSLRQQAHGTSTQHRRHAVKPEVSPRRDPRFPEKRLEPVEPRFQVVEIHPLRNRLPAPIFPEKKVVVDIETFADPEERQEREIHLLENPEVVAADAAARGFEEEVGGFVGNEAIIGKVGFRVAERSASEEKHFLDEGPGRGEIEDPGNFSFIRALDDRDYEVGGNSGIFEGGNGAVADVSHVASPGEEIVLFVESVELEMDFIETGGDERVEIPVLSEADAVGVEGGDVSLRAGFFDDFREVVPQGRFSSHQVEFELFASGREFADVSPGKVAFVIPVGARQADGAVEVA